MNNSLYMSDLKIAQRYGVSRQTVWRWTATDSTFPAPIKLSPGCTRWKLSDIEAWESQGFTNKKEKLIISEPKNENKGKLLSEEDILKNSYEASHIKKCGIYFLIRNGKIIYVGQSINIYQRLFEHRNSKRRYDKFAFIECDVEKLDLIESLYIHKFNPLENGKHSNKWGDYGGVHSPIPIGKLIPHMVELGEIEVN